jgi:hypothetical protein
MSWWTDIRDFALHPIDTVTKEVNAVKNIFRPAVDTSSQDALIAQQNKQISDAVDAYKKQTAITNQQLADAKNAADAAQRQINEKQIRTLRHNYVAPSGGILGVGQPATNDTTSQLGG